MTACSIFFRKRLPITALRAELTNKMVRFTNNERVANGELICREIKEKKGHLFFLSRRTALFFFIPKIPKEIRQDRVTGDICSKFVSATPRPQKPNRWYFCGRRVAFLEMWKLFQDHSIAGSCGRITAGGESQIYNEKCQIFQPLSAKCQSSLAAAMQYLELNSGPAP